MKNYDARFLPTPPTVTGDFENPEALLNHAAVQFMRAPNVHHPYASLSSPALGLR